MALSDQRWMAGPNGAALFGDHYVFGQEVNVAGWDDRIIQEFIDAGALAAFSAMGSDIEVPFTYPGLLSSSAPSPPWFSGQSMWAASWRAMVGVPSNSAAIEIAILVDGRTIDTASIYPPGQTFFQPATLYRSANVYNYLQGSETAPGDPNVTTGRLQAQLLSASGGAADLTVIVSLVKA